MAAQHFVGEKQSLISPLRKSFTRSSGSTERLLNAESDGILAGRLLRERMQEIARAEMSRRRSKLGQMTRQQEKALEQLLSSTVERISDPLIKWMRECYTTGDLEQALALQSDFY